MIWLWILIAIILLTTIFCLASGESIGESVLAVLGVILMGLGYIFLAVISLALSAIPIVIAIRLYMRIFG